MLEPTQATDHASGGPQPPADTPPPGTPVVVVGTPEWDSLNERRVVLIRKDIREGLTDGERAELERLENLCQAAIAVAFPFPPIWAEKLAAIEKRLGLTEDAASQ